jgi:hypothetical protein
MTVYSLWKTLEKNNHLEELLNPESLIVDYGIVEPNMARSGLSM